MMTRSHFGPVKRFIQALPDDGLNETQIVELGGTLQYRSQGAGAEMSSSNRVTPFRDNQETLL
ncbi:MAG TPA: hypothetical protein VIE17_05860 [Methylophilaceae bacterium]|jgi:hypothetical protein